LVLMIAGLMLLEGGTVGFTMVELQDWRSLWLPLLRGACTEMALLFHAAIPPWPLAVLLPLAFLILTIRVWRWPYRYGERVPVPEQKLALIALTAAGALWALLEAAAWRWALPEWLESVKLAGRLVFTALTAAGMQVWLARLVLAWEKPPDTEADRDAVAAVEGAFARWQRIVLLGAFDLVWMAWRSWRVDDTGMAAWLLPEFLLLFAALPLAVALSGGKAPPWQSGAMALKALLRALPALAGVLTTAVAFLMLARYAADMSMAACPPSGIIGAVVWVIRALALAMLHGWLCLATLLVMLRHGFHRPPSADPAR
ncbi:MAG: hypothetical protein JNG86_10465, partial [Verrucomicrobiaceae bacterium]|nr:hypothetical protein [Verrucomicrobiaceae bacterium]